ncbi:hypothetical protein BKA70DRAFT_393 [Coprinopsis sp. MPI-PUGE-AT-0042]|nr:hypothetical protein BKA70DRAFT_393 [Coprinopsis sp. MPI-PUGE-AT-0042]
MVWLSHVVLLNAWLQAVVQKRVVLCGPMGPGTTVRHVRKSFLPILPPVGNRRSISKLVFPRLTMEKVGRYHWSERATFHAVQLIRVPRISLLYSTAPTTCQR